MASLVSGAWVNPWYREPASPPAAFHSPTTFASIASVPSWDWLKPGSRQGFTSETVEHFRSKINGVKVLISFGGSNAVAGFWRNMAAAPEETVVKFQKCMSDLKADGIDYDFESELDTTVSSGLAKVMQSFKGKYVQTLCVLGSGFDIYRPIIEADVLDYVIVMCYNGGMFLPGHPSGGKDWKGWMDQWISHMKGKQSKLIVGLSLNDDKYHATPSLVDEVVQYCNENKLAGAFFWWYDGNVSRAKTIGDLIAKVTP